ncbi:MAG: alpha/beta hydrolase [Cellvibrionaceae bacterium]|nr:alpha/beta hydrolase [Cellvibrionaceae bacterium]MCV6626020.1 alpha/beta hydrolase [Cellvibrionaceae bacterium]
MKIKRSLLLCLLGLLWLPQANASQLALCHLNNLVDQVFCGQLARPENPAAPAGPSIPIHYAVLPAVRDKHPDEAVLVIVGGPGQAALDYAGHFNRILRKLRAERDILLIDQRGTGRSNPLRCETMENMDQLGFDADNVNIKAETKACKKQLDTDLSFYSSAYALEDFEAIRKQLGYQRLHLFGTSYGTRMVQLYMQKYPEAVASGIMDGVVPLSQNVLAVGESVDEALELLFLQCESQPACEQHFPNLRQQFHQLVQNLGGQSYLQAVKHPVSGEGQAMRLGKSKLAGILRLALYSAQARTLLPYTIDRIKLDDFSPLLGLWGLTIDGLNLAMGMHGAIICAEDWPRLSEADRAAMNKSLIGGDMLAGLDAACPIWNVQPQLQGFAQPFSTQLPVLMLSGRFDPATPPAWAKKIEPRLTKGQHVIFPYATHGVAGHTCAPDLMAQFVSEPGAKLDTSCVEKDGERGFFINSNASAVEEIVK